MFFCRIGFHCQSDVWANYVVDLWYAVHIKVSNNFSYLLNNLRKWQSLNFIPVMLVVLLQPLLVKGSQVELSCSFGSSQTIMLALFRIVTSMKTSWNGNLIVILGCNRGSFIDFKCNLMIFSFSTGLGDYVISNLPHAVFIIKKWKSKTWK
jgi:hypothetical protein